MRTLKELKALKTVNVKRKYIGKTKEQLLKEIQDAVSQYFGPERLKDIKDCDTHFSFENRTWFIPKIQGDIEGTVTFRSRDYYFEVGDHKSYGEITAKNLREYGFEVECYNGDNIQYHIL